MCNRAYRVRGLKTLLFFLFLLLHLFLQYVRESVGTALKPEEALAIHSLQLLEMREGVGEEGEGFVAVLVIDRVEVTFIKEQQLHVCLRLYREMPTRLSGLVEVGEVDVPKERAWFVSGEDEISARSSLYEGSLPPFNEVDPIEVISLEKYIVPLTNVNRLKLGGDCSYEGGRLLLEEANALELLGIHYIGELDVQLRGERVHEGELLGHVHRMIVVEGLPQSPVEIKVQRVFITKVRQHFQLRE